MPHPHAIAASISNPLRMLGLARTIAGAWLVYSGVMTLVQFNYLLPQAERLFNGDPGATDAPIRSLLTLVTAPVLIAIGLVLMTKGLRWMRRLPLAAPGPAAIERDEVIATLVRRELPAFGEGPSQPYWPLRRWLNDQLADVTWWRRDLMGNGVRALVRSCGFTLALGVLYIGVLFLPNADLLGPFPAGFVFVLLTATATWAALGLLLIPSGGPRIESFAFPLPSRADLSPGQVTETPPRLLDREPPGIGLTLGLTGVGVQCFLASWWKLSFIGYPLLATSISRHTGAIAGGIVLFVVGDRMVATAAELLLSFRYESTIVFVEETGGAMIGHTAELRTMSRGLNGPRHVVAATAGPHVRDAARGDR